MKAQWMCLASAFWCASLSAQTYNGWTDGNGCSAITGWAWDSSQPNTPVNVDLIDSTTLSSIATVTANIFRQDLANAGIGNGYHGFSLPVPAYLKDNRTHVALGYISGTNIQLNNGNDSWYCSPDSTGYQYYYSDVFSTINTANWTQNGWGLTVNNGLADTDVNGGSLISKVAVPGNDYEVRATLNLTGGGSYIIYLRATANSLLMGGNTGTYYAVNLSNPTFSNGSCSAGLLVWKNVAGSLTQLSSATVPCGTGSVMRAVIRGTTIAVYIDSDLRQLVGDSSIASGQPGIGAVSTGTSSVTRVDFGALDTVLPNAVPVQSVGTSSFPTRVDLQWQGVTDDPNGIGLAYYDVYRNSVWMNHTRSAEFTDATVSPSTSYTYWIVPVDFHLNSVTTVITVQTPPAGSVDPRRVGLRPTGSYWGALGENIDLLSGNLSFSLPLVKALGRGGWGVGFNLTYNSQNWRQDPGGTWNLGRDVGYGYGWKLLAGSLTPYWAGYWTLDHYTFTDASGAEYQLNANNNGVWTSKESLYVSYDSNANRLYFRDGSFWTLGCTSTGTEQDAGTMYPTIMEDTNGNQILVTHFPGQGATWLNSSARIQKIEDVRTSTSALQTYTFFYNTDLPPHLTNVSNTIGTAEGYIFNFAPSQTLTSPFSSQTFGLLNTLGSIVIKGTGAQHSFSYNSAGEMQQVTLPYGGYLRWVYGNFTYNGSRAQREVQSRFFSKDGTTANERTYNITHEPDDGAHTIHAWTKIDDPSGLGQKYWAFSQSGVNIGLATQYQGGTQVPSSSAMTQNDFTWSQDANGNLYISSTLTTNDVGQSTQAQKKTDQTVDVYGNVTQVKQYDWGALSTPLRTYNYTYLNSSAYTSRYIYNRLSQATVTNGTTVTLVQNSYDQYSLATVSGLREWDSSYATVTTRGNVTTSTSPSSSRSLTYDQAGNVKTASVNGVSASITTDGTTNYAAPTQMTTGSLTNTMSWTSFLGLTHETGPNGDSASTLYDQFARKSSTTSPFGATTTYSYNSGPYTASNPATITATTNGRRTITTFDGLGRTIKVERGDATTILSVAETEYASCACSPIGKVWRTAIPHAPGASPVWTTYTYDGIGRTLSVATVGSETQGTTTYSYWGNAMQQTDAAGVWKQFAVDGLGNLYVVREPNPAAPTDHSQDFFTTYSYDLLNNLILVSMPRPYLGGTYTQQRTFNYNNGAYLLGATNPENGTVTYTYNSYNKVATKTDAKGQAVVYTYDTYARLTKVQRYPYGTSNAEDTCQQENYYYDTNPFDANYSQYASGRLTAVQYMGGSSTYGNTCDTTFTEMYSYHQAGAKLKKRLRVTRTLLGAPVNVDLEAVYTYDPEGRMLTVQYPLSGPNLGYTYDTMGRLQKLRDLAAQQDRISNATYGPSGELLSMSGDLFNETRVYNSLVQLTSLTSSTYVYGSNKSFQYRYSATQNNGKITSQYYTDPVGAEEITYTYDALNRLASATATDLSWGQSYSYDGFGNLTDQATTHGSTPVLHVAYNAATNRQTGDCADANGNLYPAPGCSGGVYYDVENRITSPASQNQWQYSYAPGNKRVWRGLWTSGQLTTDEVTFWSVTGQRLATYQLAVAGGTMSATQTSTRTYFGSKLLIQNSGSWVQTDRLGSIGKYYPYGQERPTATQNGTEKFATYFRDTETGNDYADQRYHQPGFGRFLTPDPYLANNGGAGDTPNPGSWNRYVYAMGDPVKGRDSSGLKTFFNCGYGDEGFDNCDWEYQNDPQPGGQRGGGSTNEWSIAQTNILTIKVYIASVLSFAGNISADCQRDFDTLSAANVAGAQAVTATSVLDALTSANFKNGVGSSDLYISLYSVGSPQYNDFVANHPTMLGMTIGQDFNNPSIMADSQMGGHNIYVRPNSISKNSVFYDAGFLTHEVFHNLGFTDDQIKSALGLTDADCGSATACITRRIQEDCFKPFTPIKLP